MPTSYLASKPSPNPGIPNWLTWMKDNFFKIDPDSPQVAALVGINRAFELVVIYKPVPVIGPDGFLLPLLEISTTKRVNLPSSKLTVLALDQHIMSKTLTRSQKKFAPTSPSPTNSEWEQHLKMLLVMLPSVLFPF
jgi:hypothetical protein